MKKIVIAVLLLNLAACADKPVKPVEEPAAPQAAETLPVAPEPAQPEVVAPAPAMDPLDDPDSLLATRSVYYPFDVYVVQNGDKAAVQAHAEYLAANPDRSIRLEGNADERGSNEYNLALGQRRADGVKRLLLLGGARDSQIETASYGEEKPRGTGHDESSWSQNRRTDLIYK